MMKWLWHRLLARLLYCVQNQKPSFLCYAPSELFAVKNSVFQSNRSIELLLTNEGVAVLSELPATSNPPRIDVLLLRRAGKRWTARQRARLPDGVCDRSAAHHLLECKITESVTEQRLQQALTYDYLYRQSQQLALHEV